MSPSAPGPRVHDALAGRRVLVMGLGSFGGGAGAVRYLAQRGARVTVTDLRSAAELGRSLAELEDLAFEGVWGEHRERDVEEAELVVPNPAVPPNHPLLRLARGRGTPVRSAVELLLDAARARVVAVTGTQGKSSTCHMLGGLLRATGRKAHVGGNYGGSLLVELDAIGPEDVMVLELSSYQLEALAAPEASGSCGRARVRAVAVTNVLADHLERHGNKAAYRAAKWRILELLGEEGTAFLPAEAADAPTLAPGRRRVCLHAEDPPARPAGLHLSADAFRWDGELLGWRRDLRVPGAFQHANALVALGLARALGASAEELAGAVPELGGLPHRLEDLGWRRGRRVVDNGVSTTPDSTVAALRSLDAGCTLIAGGRLKQLSLDPLLDAARRRVSRAQTFGEAGPRLAAALAGAGVPARSHGSLDAALDAAFEETERGGTILFSPACSSFDAYPNFLARAEALRARLPAPDREVEVEVPDGGGAP